MPYGRKIVVHCPTGYHERLDQMVEQFMVSGHPLYLALATAAGERQRTAHFFVRLSTRVSSMRCARPPTAVGRSAMRASSNGSQRRSSDA
jgi:hypothetical protein